MSKAAEIPDNFARLAPTLTMQQAMTRWGVSGIKLRRWERLASVTCIRAGRGGE